MKKFLLNTLFIGLLTLAFNSSAQAAKLGLYPASDNLIQGCSYPIAITVDTEGANTRGADAFLNYNPNEIEVVDVRAGEAFLSYPGKLFGGGSIKITAFNQNGFFNGSGTLARLYIRSKPGIESASINFSYTPGATRDSNVASEDASDILTGVYGGSYTFKPGKCAIDVEDKTPPRVEDLKPGVNWKNMVPNRDLTFAILDDQSGVDIDSLEVELDGILYTKKGENSFTYDGEKAEYKITIDPEKEWIKEPDEPVPVTIRAKDLNENEFELKYNFTVYSISECPVLRAAAPSLWPYFWIISFLILFLISLIVNFYQARRVFKRFADDERRWLCHKLCHNDFEIKKIKIKK